MDGGGNEKRRGVEMADGGIEWSTNASNYRMSRVLIVCNGPSAEGVTLPTLPGRAHVIAVNGAINWLPHVNSFFSLDPSEYVRGLLRKRRPDVVYWLAVPDDYGMPTARLKQHRRPAEPWVNYLHRKTGDGFRGACPTLSGRFGDIHTGNSGYGALGLAYLMRARKIAFIGLDGGGDRYVFMPADGPLKPCPPFDYLPDLFASAVPQLDGTGVQVVNGSPDSAIDCWPRMDPSAAVEWLLK